MTITLATKSRHQLPINSGLNTIKILIMSYLSGDEAKIEKCLVTD